MIKRSGKLRVIIGLVLAVAMVWTATATALAGEYEMVDSNGEPSNAAFGFEDISSTGTDITDELSHDDDALAIPVGFDFTLYGQTYNQVYVSTNGFLTFDAGGDYSWSNGAIPSAGFPNAATYPFWDDLYLTYPTTQIDYAVLGAGHTQRLVVQWTNIGTYAYHDEYESDGYDGEYAPAFAPLGMSGDKEDPQRGVTFEAVLYRDGRIAFRYQNVAFNEGSGHDAGASATVGIENADGTDGIEYSYDEPALRDGLGILFYRYVAPVAPKLSLGGSPLDPLVSTSAVTLVPVQLTPGSSNVTVLTLTANGQLLATSTSQGTFNVPVLLDDGDYAVEGRVVDGNGSSAQATTRVVVDTHAPVVDVPGAGAVVRTGTVEVSGTAHDALSGVRSIAVNGEPTALYLDGTFSSSVTLRGGKNYVDVEAEDSLGNRATTTLCYDFQPMGLVRHAVAVTMLLDQKDVNVDGTWQSGEAAPMLSGGKVFLPAQEVLRLAGGTFRYASGQATMGLNGRTVTLGLGGSGGTMRLGTYFVPLEVLRDRLGLDVSWDEASGSVSFTYWP